MAKLWPKRSELAYDAALRSFFCMLPMTLAIIFGKEEWVVPFGQGGFFFSIMPLIPTRWGRFINMMVTTALGLGLYLIGGNSAPHLWLAVFYAFSVGFVVTMLTGWQYIGMGAIAALMPIYSAGLNAGSPDKASGSFIGFTIIIVYGGLVTLLPYWKSRPVPGKKQVDEKTRTMSGIRLGLGASTALFLGEVWSFAKLGWAPSAVASVVRPEAEDNKTRQRAKIRAGGVILGGLIAGIFLGFNPSLGTVAFVVTILAVLNGLISYTALGQIPIMYNAAILLLYSQIGSSKGDSLVDIRIIYNIIGILIALFIVYYPLPIVTRKVEEIFSSPSKAR